MYQRMIGIEKLLVPFLYSESDREVTEKGNYSSCGLLKNTTN
jgi:hypothetical protein